jgi:hypothetical protein
MHVGILSFLAVHAAKWLALRSLCRHAANRFHKFTENVMDTLGITALLDLISQMERALILLGATSIFLAGTGFGIDLGKKS